MSCVICWWETGYQIRSHNFHHQLLLANHLLIHYQTQIQLQQYNVPTSWQPYDGIALQLPNRRDARRWWQRKDPGSSPKEPTKTTIGSSLFQGSHQAGTPMEHDSNRQYQGPLTLSPQKDYGHFPSFAQEIIGWVCQPQRTWRQVVPAPVVFHDESKFFPACAKIAGASIFEYYPDDRETTAVLVLSSYRLLNGCIYIPLEHDSDFETWKCLTPIDCTFQNSTYSTASETKIASRTRQLFRRLFRKKASDSVDKTFQVETSLA